MRHISGCRLSGLNSAHLLDSAHQFSVLSVIFYRRLPSSPFCYLVSPLLLPHLSVLGELRLTSVLLSVIDDPPPSCTTPHPIQKKKKKAPSLMEMSLESAWQSFCSEGMSFYCRPSEATSAFKPQCDSSPPESSLPRAEVKQKQTTCLRAFRHRRIDRQQPDRERDINTEEQMEYPCAAHDPVTSVLKRVE